MENSILIATLVAATLPFVVSILSAFSPKTRVEDIDGYFVYDRKLDIDSFLKVSIGYSLQVASIALFFYWTFTYGVVGPVVVCLAWAVGYLLMAEAVRKGHFDSFLGTANQSTSGTSETIHGFIGSRMTPQTRKSLKNLGIILVSLASVIGLGGTMMAEIDYSTNFFMGALRIHTMNQDVLRLSIEAVILSFTGFYVLWGGYKSAVFTDRFQTPIAYVSFSIFAFGIAAALKGVNAETGISYVILVMVILFGMLFNRRRNLIKETLPTDNWDQLTAIYTFAPIIALGIVLILYFGGGHGYWSWDSLKNILFPENKSFIGFGLWGAIALIFANGIWQFIDISSLQRLQSLDKEEVADRKKHIVRALRVTGVEAGVGWTLIILTAVLLRAVGLGGTDNLVGEILVGSHGVIPILAPIFIFTVVVYMLSTISGFISALSYISFYDIVPIVTGYVDPGNELKQRLHGARFTTIFVIVIIYCSYALLRAVIPGDDIAGVLYAIYAFQIVIMPSALIAIFSQKHQVEPIAVIASVVCGIPTAYWTALHPDSWKAFTAIGMVGDSWQVIPPLASAFVACISYAIVWLVMRSLFHASHEV